MIYINITHDVYIRINNVLNIFNIDKFNLPEIFMDQLVRFINKVLLPIDNLCPPSFYLLSKLVKAKDPKEYEFHVCKCGYFPFYPKSEWRNYADE